MSEFDDLYREVILDHYKSPRHSGRLESPDGEAEGQNPLCGDEVSISVAYEGDTISDIRFEGRGCAISQAATSMLTDMVIGRDAAEVAEMSKDELLEEIGIPLTPVRLKCALLGLGVLKIALADLDICPLEELPPGTVKIVRDGELDIGVTTSTVNCTRSRIAARTTTARSARATSISRTASQSAPATGRTSTSAPGRR